jgi:hypothetical protein
MVQVTFIVIDHEILSTVIHTVPALWHVQKLSVPCLSEGKLLDSLPRNDAMTELCSGKFNVAYCHGVKTTNTTTRLNILLQGTIAWKLPQQD